MVVDDEALIRQGLLARLEFLGFSFEQVQEAGGGTEALKILEKSPVDICIVDIQMPDLDGLTFIERAKKHGGVNTQFILLSGYAEFSYAERAISLGVSDYLLKPLANEELSRAINKAMGQLEEVARRRAVDSSRKRLARTQQDFWLEREINVLLNEKNAWENRNRYPQLQERYPELLCAGEQILMLGILNIEADSYCQGSFEREDAELLRFSVRNVFSELVSCGVKLIVDNLTNMEQMYLIFIGEDAMSLREDAERIFARIYTLFEKKLDVFLSMGVSSCRKNLDVNARREAEEALKWRSAQDRLNLCFHADRKMLEVKNFPTAELNLLGSLMERGDLEGMRRSVGRIFAEQHQSRYSAQFIHMILGRILNMTLLAFPTREGREERLEELMSGFALADETTEPQELAERLYALLLGYIGQEFQEAHTEDKIKLAIQYMQQNFERNIAITELAGRYGMSPNYFSTMFKRETNQSAIAYLTNLRVQKAVWYLENTEESVVDISQKVGYEDSQYFFRVFKKIMGMTPLMYRKEYRKNASERNDREKDNG